MKLKTKDDLKIIFKKQYNGEIPMIQLPLDFKESKIYPDRMKKISFFLEESQFTETNYLSDRLDLETLLLSVYYIILWKYSAQNDITIGLPVILNVADIHYIMPLCSEINANLKVCEFINYINLKKTELLLNKESFKGTIDIEHNLMNDNEKEYFYNVLFFETNSNENEYNLDYPKCDLVLAYNSSQQGIGLNFFYSNGFRKETILGLSGHFKKILQEISKNPDMKLSNIEMLNENEKQQILLQFNDTRAEYPRNKTIHEVFQEVTLKLHDHIAVIYEDKEVTYGKLNERVNQLSWKLREKNVGPDTIVGIMLDRSLEMMIGILGILKAGGAYLPINPEYPSERIKYMLEDSHARILLTQNKFISGFCFDGEIINLDDENNYSLKKDNPEFVNSSRNLAYVIYTSGSTGKPKGVMIEHYSVINRINWMQKKYPISTNDVILQKTPFTFDVSVWELFWWFFEGARVCLLPPGGEKEPETIIDTINKNKVTTLHFVPSMLSVFLDYIEAIGTVQGLESLRQVFASGEALTLLQVKKFNAIFYKNLGATLNNLYGPTEATVDVSYFDCSTGDEPNIIPIGKPIDNISLYVLDSNRKLLPVGIQGELYITGDGLARGYLNKPDLTDEKFVDNPFVKDAKMYRTGDLAKWLPDGNIEYLGRIDHQVKIRGFRIELGEIESELLKIEGVREVVTLVIDDLNGNKTLCAYFVSNIKYNDQVIKNSLKTNLPDFMVPSYIYQIEKMPLSFNGKIDRKALLKPVMEVKGKYVAPKNETEIYLTGLWKDLLCLRQIGITDDFYQSGGDSIKAIQMIAKVNNKYQIRLKLKDLYEKKTILELSGTIQNMSGNVSEIPRITKAEFSEYYPVTFVQKPMFDAKNKIYETRYNMGTGDLVRGRLDVVKLENALKSLIERHEVLRTSFHKIGDDYFQKVHEKIDFKLNFVKCTDEKADEIMKNFVVPFDLTKTPVFKVSVLQIEEDKFYILYDMHHILYDAVTLDVFDEELWKIYKGEALLPITLQYKDYAVWQNNLKINGIFLEDEKYWLKKMENPGFLQIPIDFKETDNIEYSEMKATISKEEYQKFFEICGELKVTKLSAILGVFMKLLSIEAALNDVTVGLRVINRFDTTLERMFGCFIEKIPVRLIFNDQYDFINAVLQANQTLMESIDHALYPYEFIKEKIMEKRYNEHSELFNIIVNYMPDENQKYNPVRNELQHLKSINLNKTFSKYDINFKIYDNKSELNLVLKYRSSRYKHDRIERIACGLKRSIFNLSEA